MVADKKEKSEERILFRLKTHGSQTAQALADHLGITSVGTRLHLASLLERELVYFEDRREKVGRPTRFWFLSKSGHLEFPDNHASLTLDILDSVRSVFGEEGLEKLVVSREQHTQNIYNAALREAHTLRGKLDILAKLRTEEGYMAGWSEQVDGSFLFYENHCPICAAAKGCQSLCRSELRVFQTALGNQVKVTREEYILEGGRRCTYLIEEQSHHLPG